MAPVKRKRNLEKVSTFANMSSNQPAQQSSMPQGGGYQPGGFGPAGGAQFSQPVNPNVGSASGGPATGTGYSAPSQAAPAASAAPSGGYSEARVRNIPGAYGAPSAGLPQRSPWFGAAGGPIEIEAEDEGGDEGAPQQVGDEQQEDGAGGFEDQGDFGSGLEQSMDDFGSGLEQPAFDPLGQPGETGFGGQETQPGSAAGLTQEEQQGLVRQDPQSAGISSAAAREQREVDDEFEGLLDDLGEGQENARDQLDAAFATAARRNAEINASMGTSVSGGFAGATAQTTLDYLQQMQDMYSDFQTQRTGLLIQHLDKKRSMDFQREMSDRQEASRLISDLLASGQEIPEDLWGLAYGEAAGSQKALLTGSGAAGAGGAAGATGEAGALKNEAGDFLMGGDGLGSSGMIQGDPWGEGEAQQWYGRNTGQGQYEYYRTDENGNEVAFEPGVDGGRWPGDTRLSSRVGERINWAGGELYHGYIDHGEDATPGQRLLCGEERHRDLSG